MSSGGLLQRFLTETGETTESLRGKNILDVGCGNGLLNQHIAACGAFIVGIDISLSIERAFANNRSRNALFIQADMQYPPFAPGSFDLIHASGSLHHTNNTEYSFSCLVPLLKKGGKMSTWLYHPRKEAIHNMINKTRNVTSKLPFTLQSAIYRFILFPVSFLVKRMKGNRQNKREMMIDILDWFSPEFRWEHRPEEVAQWYAKRKFADIQTTTVDHWGFNITGIKSQ
jgi:SAM-dependent methyltransferase